MDDYKVIGIRLAHLPHILISRDLDHFSVSIVFRFLKQLGFSLRHIFSHELVIEIEVILHLFNLVHVLFI